MKAALLPLLVVAAMTAYAPKPAPAHPGMIPTAHPGAGAPTPASENAAGAGDPCPALPDSLHGYHLTETGPLADTSLGVRYRYAGPPRELVTVFLYPIPADVRTGEDLQAWVSAEGKKFEAMLPLGVQRGFWEQYAGAFANAEPIAVEGGTVPGFIAGAATKRNGRISVELQYVYAVCGRFLKVRGTLPQEGWEESDFPTFAKALAARLAGH